MIQRLTRLVDSGRLASIRLDDSVAGDAVVGVFQQVGSQWTLIQVTDASFHWGGFQFVRSERVVDAQELPTETAEHVTRALRKRHAPNIPYFIGSGTTDEVLRAATQRPDRPEYRPSEASRLIRLHIQTAEGDDVRIGRVTSLDKMFCDLLEITPFGAWRDMGRIPCAKINRIEVGSRHLKGLLKFGDPYPGIPEPSAKDR